MDIALHFALEMGGAATWACIARGCADTSHRHSKLVSWLARHRWVAQSIAALAMAWLTVELVG